MQFFLFGALEGTRTPDLPLRRRLLYPAELQTHSYKKPHIVWGFTVERVMGIEPTSPAWKAGILAVEQHPHVYGKKYDTTILAVSQ